MLSSYPSFTQLPCLTQQFLFSAKQMWIKYAAKHAKPEKHWPEYLFILFFPSLDCSLHFPPCSWSFLLSERSIKRIMLLLLLSGGFVSNHHIQSSSPVYQDLTLWQHLYAGWVFPRLPQKHWITVPAAAVESGPAEGYCNWYAVLQHLFFPLL